ncbi:archaeosine biosynthesis radical SAM protein RaSEA [Methanothermococcus sp. SCGC AD-155-C09]|nr:archaeosine biosynthesis radical SAM protein RaSEA [Methanothermococcus sp. SCGC AD-155-C09]
MKNYLRELRNKHLKKRKKKNPNVPIAAWMQEDIFLDKKIGKSLTIILRTVGCRWAYKEGGCTMCSYLMDSSPLNITSENIINQFDHALQKYGNEIYNNPKSISIKLFTSGSFLDEGEIPKDARKYILKKIKELDIKEVAIESRPEYITENNLEDIVNYLGDRVNMEIGVGIESLNEEIRNISINKGISTEEIINAINLSKEYSINIKAYLLIKPLFITERDAIEDAIYSANKCIELGCSRISYCPATVHRGTLMELLWNKNQYRPPYLWSILKILHHVKNKNPQKIIMCDTSGIPTARGAHNKLDCHCNWKIKEAITNFTITQDIFHIEEVLNMECPCKKQWKEFIEFERRNIVPLGDNDYRS